MDDELKAKIKQHYNLGQGSIQDIARVYRLDVEEVLEVLGQDDLLQVESVGDLVDASEVDPGTILNSSKRHRVHFTTN